MSKKNCLDSVNIMDSITWWFYSVKPCKFVLVRSLSYETHNTWTASVYDIVIKSENDREIYDHKLTRTTTSKTP